MLHRVTFIKSFIYVQGRDQVLQNNSLRQKTGVKHCACAGLRTPDVALPLHNAMSSSVETKRSACRTMSELEIKVTHRTETI